MKKSEYLRSLFSDFLREKRLRHTRQRDLILDAVLAAPRHVDALEITEAVKQLDSSVGVATVYRNLKMMTEAGILVERNFDSERMYFELVDSQDEHHDHLICLKCGEIFEFFNQELEQLQKKIAEDLGFNLVHHRMELYGECLNNNSSRCQRKKK